MFYKFGNKIEFDEIFWFDFFECFVDFFVYFLIVYFGIEIDVVVCGMVLDDLFQIGESVVVDEQDVVCIDLQEFLLWMFVIVLWWY